MGNPGYLKGSRWEQVQPASAPNGPLDILGESKLSSRTPAAKKSRGFSDEEKAAMREAVERVVEALETGVILPKVAPHLNRY